MKADQNRIAARAAGLKRYTSSCIHGHVERYTVSGACCGCADARKKLPHMRERRNAVRRTPEHRAKARARGVTVRRREGHAARERAYRHANPEVILLREAKKRAKQRNLPFNLTREDITVPSVCPVLGIPIVVGSGKLHDNSATLDRLIPELGYVRGNICVISFRANAIKRNASLAEVRAVAAWLERVL